MFRRISGLLSLIIAIVILFFSPLSQPAFAYLDDYNKANSFKNQGHYKQALPYFLEAEKKLYKRGGSKSLDYGAIARGLGTTYFRLSSYKNAKKYLQVALAIFKKKKGANSKSVASTQTDLADVYKAQGQYKKATHLYLKSLPVLEKKLGKTHTYVATLYNNLAVLYAKQSNNDKAISFHKKALVIFTKKFGPDHIKLAATYNNLGLISYNEGHYDKALKLIKQALVIKEEKLGTDHVAIAPILNNLAGVYSAMSHYDKALPLYERALIIRQQKLGPDHLSLAASFNNLSQHYQDISDYEKALEFQKRAHSIFQKKLGASHPSVATSLNNEALIYDKQGRYDEAIKLYKRSLDIRIKSLGKDHLDVATSLNNMAGIYKARGDYDKALQLNKQSLAIKEKNLGKDHLSVATSLNNLADIYLDQGRYDEAFQLFKRSLAIKTKNLNADHPDIANGLHNIAGVYSGLGRFDEALEVYKRSLAILEKKFGKDHLKTTFSLNNIASVYSKKGNFDKALQLNKRSLDIKKKSLGKDHPDVATSLNNMAGTYDKLQRFEEAARLYKQSIAIREKQLGAAHPLVAETYHNLAYTYESQKLYGMAYQKSQHANNILLKRISNRPHASNTIKKILQKDIFLTKSFLAWSLATHPDQGNISKEQLMTEAFQAGQYALENSISKALGQMSTRFSSGDIQLAKLIRQRQDLRKLWLRQDNALINAISTPSKQSNDQEIARLRKSITQTETEIQQLSKKLEQSFPDFINLSNPKPLSIKEVQAELGNEEVLLLFLPATKESLVFAITREEANWSKLDLGRGALKAKVAALREGLNINKALNDKTKLFDLKKAHLLYRDLFQNIEPQIKRKKRLLIVAGGALSGLPFNTLVTKEPQNAVPEKMAEYREAAWLVKRFSTAILPSVSSLKALRQFASKIRAQKLFIGFGNPNFGGVHVAGSARGKTVANVKARAFTSFFKGGLVDPKVLSQNLPQLPDTEDELKIIASKLGVPESQIFLQQQATETRLKKLPLDNYKIVYFATHALVAGELEKLGAKDKAEPALVLTVPLQSTANDDGLLTASEVAQLKLNADWVVLSACNTAAGDKPGAEALSGLSRAFIYAGARSLLVSHWPIVSDAAVKLTTRLFGLKQQNTDLGKAEALQKSMLALMNDQSDPLNAYPAIWAPFIIVGDGK